MNSASGFYWTDFFCHSLLLPIGWRNLQIAGQRQKKLIIASPPTLSDTLASSQTFIMD
jgi:hypothetical protein